VEASEDSGSVVLPFSAWVTDILRVHSRLNLLRTQFFLLNASVYLQPSLLFRLSQIFRAARLCFPVLGIKNSIPLIIKKSKFWCQKEDIVLGKISLHISPPNYQLPTERKSHGTYALEIRDLRVVFDDIVVLKVSLCLTTSQYYRQASA